MRYFRMFSSNKSLKLACIFALRPSHFGPATLPVPSGHLRLVATFDEGESKSSDKWFCVFFLYDTVRPE